MTDSFREEMAEALAIPANEVKAWKGAGCLECNEHGARGRTAIYEFFLINEELADSIEPGAKTTRLREIARKSGWRSMRENGFAKVQNGVISWGELERVTRRIDMGFLNKDDSPGRA